MSKKKARKSVNPRIVFALLMLLCTGLFTYPTFSELWNEYHSTSVITNYSSNVAKLSREDHESAWTNAVEYNRRLSETNGLEWPVTDEEQEEYDSLLSIDGTGNMGYITIPKIGVNLPVYHGTGESVMQFAVGHLMGTSLPVGNVQDIADAGNGDFPSNCVLSSHTGNPSARLFSDIDQLVEGDLFYLTILDKVLTYQVVSREIVLPENLSLFGFEPNEDYCTLVTCTPFGLNTHRLIVRAKRVPNAKGKTQIALVSDAMKVDVKRYLPVLIVPVILCFTIYILIPKTRKNKKAENVL